MGTRLHKNREGFFLVLVLIVIAVATMAVYSFTELMISADEAAFLQADLVQSRVCVDSGVETCRLILSQPPLSRSDMGGVLNNPNLFQAVMVASDAGGTATGNFTILAPSLTDTGALGGIRYGLQDESARLNVNALLVLEENSDAIGMLTALSGGSVDAGGILGTASGSTEEEETADTTNIALTLLMSLPGMTESIADAILDWIDEDTDPRPLGCEDEYYNSLPTPYSAANGPLQSVEELLLVQGVTPQLLFGADANRNGVIDLDEQQRFVANSDTPGAFGWSAYLTVHGAESNKTSEGLARVDVNSDDLEVLYEDLSAALGNDVWASFIVAYRMYGTSTLTQNAAALAGGESGNGASEENGASSESGDPEQTEKPPQIWTADVMEQLDLSAGAGVALNQILDLVDAEVTIGEGDEAVTYLSPFPSEPALLAESLPILMDQLSTQDVDVLPGRINLNLCPAELLSGLTVIDAETMTAILEARGGLNSDVSGSSDRTHEAWPLTEGIITLDQMRALLPLVTAEGDVFRAQIIGYNPSSGLFSRGEAIIDATTPNPQLVSYRDLSHLGRGFELSILGNRGG